MKWWRKADWKTRGGRQHHRAQFKKKKRKMELAAPNLPKQAVLTSQGIKVFYYRRVNQKVKKKKKVVA